MTLLPLLLPLLSAASAATPASGGACVLADSLDSTTPPVVIIESLDGACTVALDDGRTVTIEPDEDVDTCQVEDGGGNIIVIWPADRVGAACGGVNVVVIWPT